MTMPDTHEGSPLLAAPSNTQSESPRVTPKQTYRYRNASPAEVRTFFFQVLTLYHDVSHDEAKAVAAKWKYGRGSELQLYDMATYHGIFGPEAGSLLHAYGHDKLTLSLRRPETQGRKEHPFKGES